MLLITKVLEMIEKGKQMIEGVSPPKESVSSIV